MVKVVIKYYCPWNRILSLSIPQMHSKSLTIELYSNNFFFSVSQLQSPQPHLKSLGNAY